MVVVYKEIKYLTIIPRAHVGYDMIDSQRRRVASSLPQSSHIQQGASGTMILLRTSSKYRETKIKKNIRDAVNSCS